MTKLDWQVNFVVPNDYLDLLLQFETELQDEQVEGAKTSQKNPLQGAALGSNSPPGVVDNQCHTATTARQDADLICSLCCHSAKLSSCSSRHYFCAHSFWSKMHMSNLSLSLSRTSTNATRHVTNIFEDRADFCTCQDIWCHFLSFIFSEKWPFWL